MASERHRRFRHEDVESVPKGWKVRTVQAGAHRVRVAFPPGRRQKGSGRLVSVLHPLSGSNPCANPCTLRSTNPAELLVMGANPPRRRNATGYRVVAVGRTGSAGTYTSGIFNTRAEAQREAQQVARRAEYYTPRIQKVNRENPAELLVMGANPRVEIVHADNPGAEAICERFTGAECTDVDVQDEPHMPRGRYAALGPLLALYVKPAAGGQVKRIGSPEGAKRPAEYWNGHPPMVVSDTGARQIYFVKGNQDLSASLADFGARDRGNGMYELGNGTRIDYECRKEHVAHPDEDKWRHSFGEENGELPKVLFDSRTKRIALEGGDYRIDGAWIRN